MSSALCQAQVTGRDASAALRVWGDSGVLSGLEVRMDFTRDRGTLPRSLNFWSFPEGGEVRTLYTSHVQNM